MSRALRQTFWAKDTACANALRSDCGKEPEYLINSWGWGGFEAEALGKVGKVVGRVLAMLTLCRASWGFGFDSLCAGRPALVQ